MTGVASQSGEVLKRNSFHDNPQVSIQPHHVKLSTYLLYTTILKTGTEWKMLREFFHSLH